MPFESPDYPLADLMRSVASGRIQLPDFQREWKWDNDRIAALLASVSLGHPVGVLMLLEVGGTEVNFAAKPLSGAEASSSSGPERLLLDGQQRMTSFFQALASGRAVETSDGRKRRLSRWYYLDMEKALADPGDREEAIVSVPEDRVVRGAFGRSIELDLSTLDAECRAEMFPLSGIFDMASTNSWMVHYLQLDDDGMPERLDRWNRFQREVLANFTGYVVPVIVLTKETPKEAVCTVFEKVNTGGVPLDVFELLTATYASDNFRLKDDWQSRRQRLRRRGVNALESSDFLQAVTLLATQARKLGWPGSDSDRPGVSCKRKDILRLSLDEYQKWADAAEEGFDWAATFLAQEGIFTASDVPYRTQLVPLAAIRATIGDEIDNLGIFNRIRQWYWCGVLGELYGGAIETRFARDLEQVVDWVIDDGPPPGTVIAASFNSSRLLTLRTRNSAAYKGIYALLMREGCLDWQKHKPITLASFFDYRIDIHHIFPKAWCNKEENGVDAARRESIVNKTAISFDTNRSIGGRPPSEYLPTLQKRASVSAARLDEILVSHRIDPVALRNDDFDVFFDDRKRRILELISLAMGKPAIADDEHLEREVALFEDEPEDLGDRPDLLGTDD